MAKENLGLVHVYTGNGKGKTSASMGLMLRAVGQGLNVYVVQFMKGGAYTGELISSKNFLPNTHFKQFGRRCIKEMKQMKLLGFDKGYRFYDSVREDIDCGPCRMCFLNDDEQKKFIEKALEKAIEVCTSGNYDLVILDEINCAVLYGFLSEEDVTSLVDIKAEKTELVLTGRGATDKIKAKGDYVTEMKEIKHPFNERKMSARRGIEY